jgi:crotonobetainyl-CoA:carnitine CoA-transferase CaiB-like acyl-CoA transferase
MCNKEKFWGVLCEKINRSQWAHDERFSSFAARLKNRHELNVALDEVLQQQTTSEWLKVFAGQVPASAVNDVAQALDNDFAREMGMVVSLVHPQGPIRTLACPITAGPVATQAAPALGQHTAQLLLQAGFTDQQIEKLRELAVI